MILMLKKDYDPAQLESLKTWLKESNVEIHISEGAQTTIMGLIGDTSHLDADLLKSLDIVDDVKRIQEPY